MALKSLRIQNFRNYEDVSFSFKHGITVFTGSNGIGKTTILEAVALLGSGRSFRTGKNEDFIRRGQEFSTIYGDIEYEGLTDELRIDIHLKGKRVYQNEKLVRKIQNILPILPSIVFSPGDHRIIEGDSADRKQFLNRAIQNVIWDYAETLTKFNQVLLQRNQLLKRAAHANQSISMVQSQLDVWDEQFISLGINLMKDRNTYLSELQTKVQHEYTKISQSNDAFQLQYLALGEESGLNVDDSLQMEFTQRLRESLRRDFALGTTSVGPHKDEILLTLNGNKVKFYGSQGEKRTCALALRLGEVSLFREKMNRTPILLIDDVSSELDGQRRHSLVKLLREEDAQVLLTATELPATLVQDLGREIVHWDLLHLGERKHGHHGKDLQLYS